MKPDWEKVERLCHAALALPAPQRESFVKQACAGDELLQREVQSLLEQASAASGFLNEPALDAAARFMTGGHGSLIGRQIGVYRVMSALGAGGMGEVYRARDTKLGRDVALKVLPAMFTADRESLARLEREARLLATLNHPHIGAIYGLEDADGVRALVLELVEGQTLADRIAKGPLPWKEALPMAGQIAEALDAAHEKGVIHRDLKPANIKVTSDGVVKVLDFGLAKAATGEASPDLSQSPTLTAGGTREGLILGTAAYMSPEQARGRPVDKRTDIWSFGCVLYELLTGRLAFPGETVSHTIVAVLEREPNWAALPPATPQRVRHLLQRCLEKDARRRIRDIGDVRIDIEDALVTPEPAANVRESADRGKRYDRLAWVTAAILSIALVATIARNRLVNPRSEASSPPKLSPAVLLTSGPAQEFGPAISPDGKWVAYYSTARGPVDVWVKFLDSGATLNLTANLSLELPVRTGIGGLSISPDGTQIAFSARPDPSQPQYDTWVMPGPVGGVPRKLLQVIPAMQWSPDGGHLAYTIPGSSRGDALAVSDSDGNNQRVIIPAQGGRHVHWPAWSRDGKYIYFIYTFQNYQFEPSEIYRVPAAGGPLEPVVRTVRRAIFPVPMPDGDLVYAGNPESTDLGLWWLPAGGGIPQPLTNGIGEHTEPRVSANGRKLVSTLLDRHQSLIAIPVRGGATVARQLTDGYGGDLDPFFDLRGGRIVFSSTRAGHRNLWTARPDGTAATPLTKEAAIDERPTVSPDGQQIAFVSDRGGERGIWVMNAQGGAPKLLVHTVILDQLTWAPDSTQILFARPGGDLPALATVRLADGKVEPFSTPAGGFSPQWSPTADVIAYLEPVTLPAPPPSPGTVSRMWLKFVDGHGRALFTDLPKQQFTNGLLAWSPDGRRVSAVSIPTNGATSIWIVDPASSTPFQKLTELPGAAIVRGITWTPDSSTVIVAKQEPTSDIVLYDLTP